MSASLGIPIECGDQKLEKNWPAAATSALRDARGCLELLGKLGGELQTGGNVHLGVAVNLYGSQSEPQTLEDLELATAQLIAEATSTSTRLRSPG